MKKCAVAVQILQTYNNNHEHLKCLNAQPKLYPKRATWRAGTKRREILGARLLPAC